MNPSDAILIAILLPLAGAVLIALTGAMPNLRETVTLVTAALLAFALPSLTPWWVKAFHGATRGNKEMPTFSSVNRIKPIHTDPSGVMSSTKGATWASKRSWRGPTGTFQCTKSTLAHRSCFIK